MKKSRTLMIVAILYLAYTVIYTARLNLSAASVSLAKLHILSSGKYGIIAGVFSAVYACGRLLNGVICDRVHPAWTIGLGLAVTGLANVGISFFPPYVMMLVLWGLNAYAQSMLWSSILKMIACLYEESKAKKVTTYVATSVAVGNILGMVVNAYLIENFGTKFAFLVPGIMAVTVSLLCICTMAKVPCHNGTQSGGTSFAALAGDRNLKQMILPVFFHGMIKDNVSLFLFQYLAAVYAAKLMDSAFIAMFIPLMGLVGRFCYPIFYKMTGYREHKVSAIAFGVSVLVGIPLLFRTSVFVAAGCMGLIYGVMSVVNTTALSIFPIQYADSGNVATVGGIMDFSAYLGCSVGSFLFGIMIPKLGYSSMFAVWAVLAGVSILLLRPLVEKREVLT